MWSNGVAAFRYWSTQPTHKTDGAIPEPSTRAFRHTRPSRRVRQERGQITSMYAHECACADGRSVRCACCSHPSLSLPRVVGASLPPFCVLVLENDLLRVLNHPHFPAASPSTGTIALPWPCTPTAVKTSCGKATALTLHYDRCEPQRLRSRETWSPPRFKVSQRALQNRTSLY
jgi:hypothetical protein